MMPVGARAIGVLSVAALTTALASSCAAPPRTNANVQSSVKSSAPIPARHIVQLDFGRAAAFASCLPPACPAATPKTLAIEVPPELPMPRPTEPTATLDRGENRRLEIDFEREAGP